MTTFEPPPVGMGSSICSTRSMCCSCSLAAYAGEIAESMTRTYAWRFLDLGRRLERALQESQLVRGMLANSSGSEPESFETLLGNARQRDDVSLAIRLAIPAWRGARPHAVRRNESAVGRLPVGRVCGARRSFECGRSGGQQTGRSRSCDSLLRTVRDTDVVRISRRIRGRHTATR